MSEEINVLARQQVIIVDPPSGSVAVINAGSQGPAGSAGADGIVANDGLWAYDEDTHTLSPEPTATTPLYDFLVTAQEADLFSQLQNFIDVGGSQAVAGQSVSDGNIITEIIVSAVTGDSPPGNAHVSSTDEENDTGASVTVLSEGSISLTADDVDGISYELDAREGQINLSTFVDSGDQQFLQLDANGGNFSLEAIKDNSYTYIDGNTGETADGIFLTHSLDDSDVYEAYFRTSAYRGSSAFLQLNANQPGKGILETFDADNDGWYLGFYDPDTFGSLRIDLQMLPPWELEGSGYIVLAVGSGSGTPGGVVSLVASGDPDTGDFTDLAIYTDGTDLKIRRHDGTVLTVTAT